MTAARPRACIARPGCSSENSLTRRGPAVAEVLWRVPDRRRRRLRPWVRNPVVAQGHVVAPDGGRDLVQVVRLSWPQKASPVGEGIGALLPNTVSLALSV